MNANFSQFKLHVVGSELFEEATVYVTNSYYESKHAYI